MQYITLLSVYKRGGNQGEGMKETKYSIKNDDGDRICDCLHREDGNIILEAKNGSISWTDFQLRVINPKLAMKNRGKNYKK